MGTSHRTIETPVFLFDQLSEAAQARALDKNRENNVDYEWWDAVYEDAIMLASILGIEIDTRRGSNTQPSIYFSGFSSQGDGACFEGSYSYKKGALKELTSAAPEYYQEAGKGPWIKLERNAELHRICKALTAVQRPHFYRLEATVKQRGHYQHSGCTSVEVKDCEYVYRDIGGAEDEVKQLLRDFMDWIYTHLEREHNYLTSDEAVKESLQETEFDEDGDRV